MAGMIFGHYAVFQCPPWLSQAQVMAEEMERVELAEKLGYDMVWVPEQHFSPYCMSGDALLMASQVAARTRRVGIGTAVVNLTFTHPLRFLERVAMLDHLTGGRVEVGVGRGYQIPQCPAFDVDPARSRPMFDESLDIIMAGWDGSEVTYAGQYYNVDNFRVWPSPLRPAGDVLLHAVNSPESVTNSIQRGLPALMARPITPFDQQVTELLEYRKRIEEAGLDPEPFMERATVLKYAFLAPSAAEARETARRALEWDLAVLGKLMSPETKQMPDAQYFYDLADAPETAMSDEEYQRWCDEILLFDDPATCADKIAMLRDAGARRVLLWMGLGGLYNDQMVRSMQLFAEKVAPLFR